MSYVNINCYNSEADSWFDYDSLTTYDTVVNYRLGVLKNQEYTDSDAFKFVGNIENGFRNWNISNILNVAPVGYTGTYEDLFPGPLVNIQNSFRNCNQLLEAYLTDDTVNADNAYRGCSKLQKAVFGSNLEDIQNMYFGCPKINGDYYFGNNIDHADKVFNGREFTKNLNLHIYYDSNTNNTFWNEGVCPFYTTAYTWDGTVVDDDGYYYNEEANTYVTVHEMDNIKGKYYINLDEAHLYLESFDVKHRANIVDLEYDTRGNYVVSGARVPDSIYKGFPEFRIHHDFTDVDDDRFRFDENMNNAFATEDGLDITDVAETFISPNIYKNVKNCVNTFENCKNITNIYLPVNTVNANGMYSNCPNVMGSYDWKQVNNVVDVNNMFYGRNNKNTLDIYVTADSDTDKAFMDYLYALSKPLPDGYSKRNINIHNGIPKPKNPASMPIVGFDKYTGDYQYINYEIIQSDKDLDLTQKYDISDPDNTKLYDQYIWNVIPERMRYRHGTTVNERIDFLVDASVPGDFESVWVDFDNNIYNWYDLGGWWGYSRLDNQGPWNFEDAELHEDFYKYHYLHFSYDDYHNLTAVMPKEKVNTDASRDYVLNREEEPHHWYRQMTGYTISRDGMYANCPNLAGETSFFADYVEGSEFWMENYWSDSYPDEKIEGQIIISCGEAYRATGNISSAKDSYDFFYYDMESMYEDSNVNDVYFPNFVSNAAGTYNNCPNLCGYFDLRGKTLYPYYWYRTDIGYCSEPRLCPVGNVPFNKPLFIQVDKGSEWDWCFQRSLSWYEQQGATETSWGYYVRHPMYNYTEFTGGYYYPDLNLYIFNGELPEALGIDWDGDVGEVWYEGDDPHVYTEAFPHGFIPISIQRIEVK